jgi:hypothetical protein
MANLGATLAQYKSVGLSPPQAKLTVNFEELRRNIYFFFQDHEGVPLNLAVAHMGVLVFQHFTKINCFSWCQYYKAFFIVIVVTAQQSKVLAPSKNFNLILHFQLKLGTSQSVSGAC